MTPLFDPRCGGVRHDCEAGFSLLEVLVSLALLSLMLALVPDALRLAREAWRTEPRLERADAMAAVQQFLAMRLERAEPGAISGEGRVGAAFDGTATSVEFLASAPDAESRGGLRIYRVALQDREDVSRAGVRRVLSITGAEPPLSGERGASTATLSQSAPGEGARPEGSQMLIEDVTHVAFRYFGETAEGRSERAWQSSWHNRIALPALVEVTLAFKGQDGPPKRIVVAPRLRRLP